MRLERSSELRTPRLSRDSVMVDVLTPDQRRRNMSRIRGRNTAPELAVRAVLRELGFRRYQLHRKALPGCPDIVLTRKRRVIFVNGCFWHRHACSLGSATPKTNTAFWKEEFARNVARDREARLALHELGWGYTTIWECQLDRRARIRDRLARAVQGRPFVRRNERVRPK